MKILLTALNAKFIHSNLAIRMLKAYAQPHLSEEIRLLELTVNQPVDQLLREIYQEKPDLLGLSCYIWNYGLIRMLVPELKALLPECVILLGGPEISCRGGEALEETGADLAVCGEGERPFLQLAERLEEGRDFTSIPGLAYRGEDGFHQNPPELPPDLGDLPFPYEAFPEHGILYYESSRGCPFSCRYCLSGGDGRVRLRPLEQVFRDLDRFLAAGVRQVKFVDRTFNCNRDHAMGIWKYLARHDNGVTNFHFELAAELLDEECLAFLDGVRKGLFQFEIGVQSTNPPTLRAVHRVTLPERLTPAVRRLRQAGRIHLHLDLIAGLPFEGYERFGESFNYVYSLKPDQLQLGFLKLLRGSGLYADRERYGLRATQYPPYEVTGTPWLTYDEILRLKLLAEMVELYYNSCRYGLEVEYLCGLFPTPYLFFQALGDFYGEKGYHRTSHSRLESHTILWEFLHSLGRGDPERFQWYAKYDLCAHERPKGFPEWLTASLKEEYRERILEWFSRRENQARYLAGYEGLDPRQLIRMFQIEVFPFHPVTGEERRTALLFLYHQRDLLGRAPAVEVAL